jgi:hypothetical protein
LIEVRPGSYVEGLRKIMKDVRIAGRLAENVILGYVKLYMYVFVTRFVFLGAFV